MMMLLRVFQFAVCAFFLLSCASSATIRTGGDAGGDPFSALIRFYEGPLEHMASVRGGECPMYPSCSVYAKAALKKYGPLVGWMMMTDRLMRCGQDELGLAPKIYIEGKWKTYDPLENNDFWWSEGRFYELERRGY